MKDNRETVIVRRPGSERKGAPVEPLVVTYTLSNGQQTTTQPFTQPFLIGRAAECDVFINSDVVSRHHARVYHDGHIWRIKDLESTNGIFREGNLITEAEIANRTQVYLGHDGPAISLCPHTDAADGPSSTGATEFSHPSHAPFPGRRPAVYSEIVRQAFQEMAKKHARKYKSIITVLSLLLVTTVSIGVLGYLHLKSMAVDIFYTMKTMELEIAKLQDTGLVKGKRQQLDKMATQYDSFVDKLHVFDWELDSEDKIILRMARIFGECELKMPTDFIDEVKKYIRKWRSSKRFEAAIRRAKQKGYIHYIYEALVTHNLPPQFFYLALQESNLRHTAVGKQTKNWGIAKGMWQFIPETGRRYDLRTGPLVQVRRYDPRDDRHDFKKSTWAAARYLRDIYTTEAQASGLLVMASYNWGEGNIVRLLRSLPENPREVNFWQLLQKHNIPSETYDYVLYIFSAAVIGENPRLFGFDFDNPLAGFESSPHADG